MLSLKWTLTAEKEVTDAIPRPSREAIIRKTPASLKAAWDKMDMFDLDLMASTASVLIPDNWGGTTLFLLVRLCPFGGNPFVDARRFDWSA